MVQRVVGEEYEFSKHENRIDKRVKDRVNLYQIEGEEEQTLLKLQVEGQTRTGFIVAVFLF
jgi:hypothetical protein